MTKAFRVKRLTSIEELTEAQALESHVWNMPSTPVLLTRTTAKNGGITLGAYDGDRLVAFSFGFPGYRDGQIYFCSHMLGVHKDYRKSGLGQILKWKQREIALEMGYTLITWTFDPLEGVNATLNLHKLGAIAVGYDENHYGTVDDGLNTGLPTDRFLVEWWIANEYVTEKRAHHTPDDWAQAGHIIEAGSGAFPVPLGGPIADLSRRANWSMAIPLGFQIIKTTDFELAKRWRFQVRAAAQALIRAGWVAVDFVSYPEERIGRYIFEPGERFRQRTGPIGEAPRVESS